MKVTITPTSRFLVYETITCAACAEGNAHCFDLCMLFGRPVNKYPDRRCPYCGSRNRHSHGIVREYTVTCHVCNGAGKRLETAMDTVPDAIWRKYPFRVTTCDVALTWSEAYLGLGTIYALMDYGEHHKLTDAELIAHVRNELGYVQVAKLIVLGKTSTRLADYIAIIRKRDGYILLPGVDS